MRRSAGLLLLALGCRPESHGAPTDTGEPPIVRPADCDKKLWYTDADGDGWGDAGAFHRECDAPPGTVDNGADCDDTNADVFPSAVELCNGIDDDCDTETDEDDAADAPTWYVDGDGDGYGDPEDSHVACDAPFGTVADATDCDDADSAVSPAGLEVCNTLDDDCDTEIDEDDAEGAGTWYVDGDGDGYGDPDRALVACALPLGAAADATDCDDTDADTYPGADDPCEDAIDTNCDVSDDVCLPPELPLSGADFEVHGSDRSARYVGMAMVAGDTDGDGYEDLLVGAPYDDGEARFLRGPVTSGDFASAERVTYGTWYEGAGGAVALGDYDGDGLDDAVVTFPGTYYYASYLLVIGGTRAGGRISYFLLDAPSRLATGDLTGDGADDLTVTSSGDLAVFDNALPVGGTLADAVTTVTDGNGLTTTGDLDADGFDDLVVGSDATSVLVLLGPLPAGTLSAADADATIAVPPSAFTLGDVDGDGDQDLVLGSVASRLSTTYLFHDATSGALEGTDADGTLFGEGEVETLSLAAADYDRDGVDDLLIGEAASRSGSGTGAAWLWYGLLSGTGTAADATFVLPGEAAGDYAGCTVVAADATGDGYPDAIVSAPYKPYGTWPIAGSVYGVSLEGR